MLRLFSHQRVEKTYRVLSRIQFFSFHQIPSHKNSSSTRPGRSSSKAKKTTIDLDFLPQGVIQLNPLSLEEDVPSYPTVVQQARSNMQKFENCVLLTRVGGFYELYFEQAEEIGPLLSLKVAVKKTHAGPVSMAGFPFFQLDRYVKILVQDLNRYVAISEEFPNDDVGKLKAGGLMHSRRVNRVITPGTLIDEDFMDPFSNCYILAIHIENLPPESQDSSKELHIQSLPHVSVGLAWIDLSTGHFFTQHTNMVELSSVLARISPREIILDESLKNANHHDIFNVLKEDTYFISYSKRSETKHISKWNPMMESPVPSRTAKEFTSEEITAGSFLLQYVEVRLQGSDTKLQPPIRQLNLMSIDKNTMRALEIRKSLTGDSIVGSLLHSIRHTVTKGGARLLDRWLGSPSTTLSVINSRLDLVEYLIRDEKLRLNIKTLLRRCQDSQRLVQKVVFGRGVPDDLLALASTIETTEDILNTFNSATPNELVQSIISRVELDGPKALAKRIRVAIDEEGVIVQQRQFEEDTNKIRALAESVLTAEGSMDDDLSLPKVTLKKKPSTLREYYSESFGAWMLNPQASKALKQLHDEFARLTKQKEELEKDLCKRLGAASLTLRFTNGLGHICHVKGKDVDISDKQTRSVGSSRTTRSFHHPEWTELGFEIDQCTNRMRTEEQRVFQSLRKLVVKNIVKIRKNAAVIDELDVASSSAQLAVEKNWSRPILNSTNEHKIFAGRHPAVEHGLENQGRGFITNDCFVGYDNTTWLITGPNMGGKSTFLRQNAIITILAQIGSYVPASYAEIGIVDRIFSRIGSADNLYKDQSTFMLEMLETAQILKQATTKSFVIMDEVGRGTTPEDGEAVAWACLWYLTQVNKCRTLFATHFHGLTDRSLSEKLRGIGLWCTDIEEEGDSEEDRSFRYIHKLRKGVNKKSHALKVARLAGLPEVAIMIAKNSIYGEKNSA